MRRMGSILGGGETTSVLGERQSPLSMTTSRSYREKVELARRQRGMGFQPVSGVRPTASLGKFTPRFALSTAVLFVGNAERPLPLSEGNVGGESPTTGRSVSPTTRSKLRSPQSGRGRPLQELASSRVVPPMRLPSILSGFFVGCFGLVSGAQAQIRFEDVTEAAGLKAPLAGLMGHGGAWGDFDGDGRIDLFAGGFCDRPNAEYAPAAGPVGGRLFRNEGGGKFAVVEMP